MMHLRFTIYDLRRAIFAAFVLFVSCPVHGAPKGLSPIISVGSAGHLIYDPDEHGNRVADFSTCGYAGGNTPIPEAPVRVVVAPITGDETERVQKAIDYVGNLPADSNGRRGAVLLLKGRHEILGQLKITNSGVVLRGQGMGVNGTTLVAAGTDRRTLVRIAGTGDSITQSNAAWQITDDYVPVGSTTFHVKDASDLQSMTLIRLIRPSTKEWIASIGMTEFGGGIGDWRLVWHPGSYDVVWDRMIQKVDGNLITLDAPITTALEKSNASYLVSFRPVGHIENIGIENLRLESTFDPQNLKDENHSWLAITMENAADAWVRQVTFQHFAGSAVAVYESCKRVTVEDCLSLAPISEAAGWRRNTFYTVGQQTLFLRCYSEHGRHDFAVGHCAAGPNAFVQCEASLPQADSGAIESWSSGTLFDNVRIDGGGLNLMNRGSAGEGAGWSAANSVLWQCSASKVSCENPPGAQNWAFGCWGEFEGNGVWREANSSVKPQSLFIAQVADRLGVAAAAKIRLMPRSLEEFSNPTIEQAGKLIEMSRQPSPSLADFIVASAQRDPIPKEAGSAKSVDDLPNPPHASRITHHVSITNGWLVCDGKLLIGTTAPVSFWRGNMRPSEAKNYGVMLTRFAPGREGAGFTDDLNEIADGMISKNQVALDHHYGLWYDRRREDHERVRRADGDVWAPFYEQPFARVGQRVAPVRADGENLESPASPDNQEGLFHSNGTAWDGLSKYDLGKFNPWYWSRLQGFAKLCDERGLVLFNENYFQHNILEAGAHWVDCPWRAANNLNETGFPEPPPFAGDKRIFMAEQFYDVSNSNRRKLNENFIRHNLDNFTNEANVIQFTSGEFTGPLAFEQFWLDTIGEWERKTKFHPLIALAATKDVQDTVLADARRAAVIDVVCFRYWWQTDKGLFAPKGGQNLAPRQFERQWKGGMPNDENLAGMAAEYRQKFSDKAIIASGEDADMSKASWAFLCAGGSLPNLPGTCDTNLLAAIPRMQLWVANSGKRLWALREPGKQILAFGNRGAELEFSGEAGSFRLNPVDPRSGKVTRGDQVVQAAGTLILPGGVVWLIKE